MYATDGMHKPFDLIADGGADNVWIVECGRAAESGSFADFRAAVAAAPVQVTPLGPGRDDGTSDGFDVVYDSPSRGRMSFGWRSPLIVRGVEQPLGGFPRYDNPFAQTASEATTIDVAAEGYGVRLDFASGERELRAPR